MDGHLLLHDYFGCEADFSTSSSASAAAASASGHDPAAGGGQSPLEALGPDDQPPPLSKQPIREFQDMRRWGIPEESIWLGKHHPQLYGYVSRGKLRGRARKHEWMLWSGAAVYKRRNLGYFQKLLAGAADLLQTEPQPSGEDPKQDQPLELPGDPSDFVFSYEDLGEKSAFHQQLLQIERDLPRTAGEHKLPSFDNPESWGRRAMRQVLGAFVMHNPNQGYVQSMNFIVCMLLLGTGSAEDAFWLLVTMIEDLSQGMYMDMGHLMNLMVIFEKVVEARLPFLYGLLNRFHADVKTKWGWFLSFFFTVLPLHHCMVVLDMYFLQATVDPRDCPTVLFQVGLSLLQYQERVLMHRLRQPLPMPSVADLCCGDSDDGDGNVDYDRGVRGEAKADPAPNIETHGNSLTPADLPSPRRPREPTQMDIHEVLQGTGRHLFDDYDPAIHVRRRGPPSTLNAADSQRTRSQRAASMASVRSTSPSVGSLSEASFRGHRSASDVSGADLPAQGPDLILRRAFRNADWPIDKLSRLVREAWAREFPGYRLGAGMLVPTSQGGTGMPPVSGSGSASGNNTQSHSAQEQTRSRRSSSVAIFNPIVRLLRRRDSTPSRGEAPASRRCSAVFQTPPQLQPLTSPSSANGGAAGAQNNGASTGMEPRPKRSPFGRLHTGKKSVLSPEAPTLAPPSSSRPPSTSIRKIASSPVLSSLISVDDADHSPPTGTRRSLLEALPRSPSADDSLPPPSTETDSPGSSFLATTPRNGRDVRGEEANDEEGMRPQLASPPMSPGARRNKRRLGTPGRKKGSRGADGSSNTPKRSPSGSGRKPRFGNVGSPRNSTGSTPLMGSPPRRRLLAGNDGGPACLGASELPSDWADDHDNSSHPQPQSQRQAHTQSDPVGIRRFSTATGARLNKMQLALLMPASLQITGEGTRRLLAGGEDVGSPRGSGGRSAVRGVSQKNPKKSRRQRQSSSNAGSPGKGRHLSIVDEEDADAVTGSPKASPGGHGDGVQAVCDSRGRGGDDRQRRRSRLHSDSSDPASFEPTPGTTYRSERNRLLLKEYDEQNWVLMSSPQNRQLRGPFFPMPSPGRSSGGGRKAERQQPSAGRRF